MDVVGVGVGVGTVPWPTCVSLCCSLAFFFIFSGLVVVCCVVVGVGACVAMALLLGEMLLFISPFLTKQASASKYRALTHGAEHSSITEFLFLYSKQERKVMRDPVLSSGVAWQSMASLWR